VRVVLGVGWFPAEEWARAIERWPDLTDEMPAAHDEYRAAIEARLHNMRPQLKGARLGLVPLSVEEVEARAATDELDAGSAEVRGRVAAEATRQGRAVPWPPARNEPCWCGSGAKYKRCCAARRPAATGAG
jgi:uncharacterized protein YecA (UPF0149 family)